MTCCCSKRYSICITNESVLYLRIYGPHQRKSKKSLFLLITIRSHGKARFRIQLKRDTNDVIMSRSSTSLRILIGIEKYEPSILRHTLTFRLLLMVTDSISTLLFRFSLSCTVCTFCAFRNGWEEYRFLYKIAWRSNDCTRKKECFL